MRAGRRNLQRAAPAYANAGKRRESWSADGRWIYFSSNRSGDYEVWRMPADGGCAGADDLEWRIYGSRVGRRKVVVLLETRVSDNWFLANCAAGRGPGQPETVVTPNVPYRAAATWALGTRELFYYPSVEDPAVRFPPVRAVNLETGRTRDLPVGNIRLARGLSLSPDGRWLVRSQIDRALTLVMIAE